MTFIRTLLRQPFLHFLLAGLVIFAVDAVRKGPQDDSAIIVNEAERARLASGWERAWGAPPTDQDMAGLIDDWVAEEVYVRQARALGLDVEDPVIRKYLRRKMELLTEGVVVVPEPTEEELRAYYSAHVDQFSTESQISFQQAVLDRGTEDDLQGLVDALNSGAEAETLPAVADVEGMQGADRFHVSRAYGVSFYDQLVGLAPGRWEGPVASSVGMHLVRVEDKRQAEPVPYDVAKPAVRAAWRAETRDRLERDAFDRLKSYYTIKIEDAPA